MSTHRFSLSGIHRRIGPARLVALCVFAFTLGVGGERRPAQAQPPALRLFEQSIPSEVSTPPEPKAWKTAPVVTLERPLPSTCQARLVREWLRIRCRFRDNYAAGAAVLTGDPRDVGFFMTREKGYGGTTELVMPLRRGDRRVVQLTQTNGGYEGIIEQDPLLLVSMHWLRTQSGPVVTASPTAYRGKFRGLLIGDRAEAEPIAKKHDRELRWEAPWVLSVDPGSAAAKAGVNPGDKFLNEGLLVFEDSAEAVHRYLVFYEGDAAKLAVMRGKSAAIKPFTVPITPRYP
jgi:hypothetical protein